MATNYERLVQTFEILFEEVLEAQREYKRGLLGNGNGEIHIPGRPDFVWVREDKFSSKIWQVFNKRVLSVEEGTPVLIGELPWQPGLIQVVDIDWRAYANVDWSQTFTAVPAHYTTHQYPSESEKGPDAVNVFMPALQPLKTTADGLSLYVTVQPYSYHYNNAYKAYLGGVLDLTSYLPSAGNAKYVLVYLNKSTNLLGVAEGSEVVDSVVITTPKPDVPTDAVPSGYVRLTSSTTSISNTTGVLDARGLFDGGDGGGSTDAGNGFVVVHVESDQDLTVPETHQWVIHEDNAIIDGDVTLNGNMLFDVDKYAVDVPSGTYAPGVKGNWVLDDDYVYFCVRTDDQSGTWKRTALSTW